MSHDLPMSTPRSTTVRAGAAAVATTPHRRSQLELLDQLNSLFDSLDAPSSSASSSSSVSASRPTSPLLAAHENPGPAAAAAARTAPLRLVPALLHAFEQKRGIQLLEDDERDQLVRSVRDLPDGMEDQPVGVEQLFDLLVGLGVTVASAAGTESVSAAAEGAREAIPATATLTVPPPATPTAASISTIAAAMLHPDDAGSYRTGDGSPVRRSSSSSQRRQDPAASKSNRLLSSAKSPNPGPRPGLEMRSGHEPPPPPAASHIPVPVSKKRTPVPRSSATEKKDEEEEEAPSPNAPVRTTTKTMTKPVLRRRRTVRDLAELEREERERRYLGVALDHHHQQQQQQQQQQQGRLRATNRDQEDRPMPEDEVVAVLAKKVKTVLSSKGPTRERDLLALLVSLSHGHLEALNLGYAAATTATTTTTTTVAAAPKTLLDIILADRAVKGTAEFALRGLLMGPLAFDAHLVQKALEAAPTNDALLVELLVGRSPSSLASLRLAFAERPIADVRPSTSRVPVSASPKRAAAAASSSSGGKVHARSLDVAVLSAYSAHTPVRNAWEVALQGTWADLAASETTAPATSRGGKNGRVGDEVEAVEGGEYRNHRLLDEDLDQLQVALRRGGSTDTVASILLARSPVHLRKLCEEFALSSGDHSSLSRAIKQAVPAGVLRHMFLHAVRAAHHVSDTTEYGVWRDAKTLQRVVDAEHGARCDELVARLLRLRWDRIRYGHVQAAFEAKYRVPLAGRLAQVLPAGHVGSAVILLLLEVGPRSSGPPSSATSDASTVLTTSALPVPVATATTTESGGNSTLNRGDPAELEAEGELPDPASPRSPPMTTLSGTANDGLADVHDHSQHEEASQVGGLARSTSSLSCRSEASFDRPSSAMSSRSRSSAVEDQLRSSSSASVHEDSSRLSSSLRHARPMAPSRAKRRQSEELARSQRGGSAEPLSPREDGALSPTWSHASRGSLSRSASRADSNLSLASSVTSQLSSHAAGHSHDDGGDAIDPSSFFATPLSPIRDESRSLTFFPNHHSSTPPSAFPSGDPDDLFATVTGTPDSPERYFAGLMRRDASQTSNPSAHGGSSRPSSLFGDGMLDRFLLPSPGDGPGTVRGNEQFQQLLRHAQDLAKKLKDNESRFHASASQFESEVAELEGQLEEARSELLAKRREEKELRGIEKEHLQQISLLEGEVANLNKSLERSREAYDAMKRNYTATCEEADRLRTLVAGLRRENRTAEEAIQGHSLQVQYFERDHQRLQQAVEKLEGELAAARHAQDALDDQKQENLMLKETIDKLRFEIEEMRSVGPRSGFLEPGPNLISPSKSLAASISKSIGREIATRMSADDAEESEEDEAPERDDATPDDIDDIIVTTHRRIRKRGKRSTGLPEPIVHVGAPVHMADADCQTVGPRQSVLHVQTELTALDCELVAKRETEEEPCQPELTAQQMRDKRAAQLGVEVGLDLAKQLANAKQTGAGSTSTPTTTGVRQPPWAVAARRSLRSKAPAYLVNLFPCSARPHVAQLLDSGLSLVLYTATIYLVGMLSGCRWLPQQPRPSFSSADCGLYSSGPSQWEGFGVGAGADGGFAPEGFARRVMNALSSGARIVSRVPV